MRKTTKRILTGAVITAVLLGGGGIAYAYWTAGGTGSGTGATGTVAGSITVNQTSSISNLRPGGTAQALSGNFDNSDTSPVYVSSVAVTISSVTGGAVAPGDINGCDAGDYTIAGSPMTVNAQVPAGAAQGSWSGATIVFKNEAAENQDACQGATVHLSYTAS
jgi:hypothetical protein